jgi:uncharacterized membrane protein YcaP (DUF421 family)
VEKNRKSGWIIKFDLMGSIRKNGYGSLDEVEVIIVESENSFSVIEKSDNLQNSTFENMIIMKEKKLN